MIVRGFFRRTGWMNSWATAISLALDDQKCYLQSTSDSKYVQILDVWRYGAVLVCVPAGREYDRGKAVTTSKSYDNCGKGVIMQL